jgi:tetratricopeptide (TPR) repeat protein
VEQKEFGDPEAAISLYERALEHEPEHIGALQQLAALRDQSGAYEGALDAQNKLRGLVPEAEQPGLLLKSAALLIDKLQRAPEGFALLGQLLELDPTNKEALGLLLAGLKSDESRLLAAKLLEQVLPKQVEPRELLKALLNALEGSSELYEQRKAWYQQLLADERGEAALELACRAARELPDDEALWEQAEKQAAELEAPEMEGLESHPDWYKSIIGDKRHDSTGDINTY